MSLPDWSAIIMPSSGSVGAGAVVAVGTGALVGAAVGAGVAVGSSPPQPMITANAIINPSAIAPSLNSRLCVCRCVMFDLL